MRSSANRLVWTSLALALILAIPERARADMVYLALGDSVSFGIDPSTPAAQTPSYGDQGFVRPFADFLASANGGVRPTVLNLAVSGELSTSFFSAVSPLGWTQRAPELNLNYPSGGTSQNDLMTASLASIHAAGDSVGYASFLIGANDLFYLTATPAFQAASPADQIAMVAGAIGTIQGTYVALLSELTALAPEARIILPGYYNPFPAQTPQHDFYDLVLASFNPLIAADAAHFGATYVDLYAPFAGRELELTNVATGDVHPNQAGYAVINGALNRAVPEPASLLMVGLGGLGLLGYARRRARKSASAA